MFKDIKFIKRLTAYLGRNGQMKCSGLTLTKTMNRSVMIEPLTSKGVIGRSLIEIPNEDIPAVIQALKQLSPSNRLRYCHKCCSKLFKGYCPDQTCPYNSHKQDEIFVIG